MRCASLVFSCALSLLALNDGTAQSYATDRGSIKIAGSGGFTSSKVEGASDRTTTLELRPDLQYFVAPGVGLGGVLTLVRSSNGDDSNTFVGVGPAASYYFGGSTSTLPFVSGQLAWATTRFSGSDVTQMSIRGAVGVLLLITNSVGINTELFYNRMHADFAGNLGDTDSNAFGLALGVAAFLF